MQENNCKYFIKLNSEKVYYCFQYDTIEEFNVDSKAKYTA